MLAWVRALVLIGAVACPVAAHAVGPYPVNLCAADRVSHLNCTANDVEIAKLDVTNNVTTCIAGTPVALDLTAFLHVNAENRHDIGLFLSRDGKSPVIPSAEGGSADCAVFGLPQSPPPFADLDGNACGDFDRNGLPQGTPVSLDLGTVTYTCVADETGHLIIPSVVSWHENPSVCNAPPAAWVEPGAPSKCEFGVTAQIEVLVQGRIVITKQTSPGGEPAAFSFTATGTDVNPASFSLSDGQSQTVVTAPLDSTPQPYTISEAALPGWNPTAEIVCTDAAGNPASFVTVDNANRTLTANMTATSSEAFCTVINQKIGTGTITIAKTTIGGDGTFNFTGFNDFSITTVGQTGSQAFPNLAPGTYTVTESIIPGWDVTGVTCSGAATPPVVSIPGHSATITLAAGENVTCTFTDTRTGSITINKVAVGGDASFGYTATGTDLSDFSILTVGGTGTKAFTGTHGSGVLPGSYSVTELPTIGWNLTGVQCTGTAVPATINGGTVNITLGSGENAVCTYTNTKPGQITINKLAQGEDGTFDFTGTGGIGAFSITTSGSVGQQIISGLAVPGTYTVTESVLAGWDVTGVTCSGAATPPVVSVPGHSATITLAAGESVVCTFTDTRSGSITIKKVTVGGDATFNFTATGTDVSNFPLHTAAGTAQAVFTGPHGLLPGSYSFTELPTSGWNLTGVQCTGTAVPATITGGTVSITLGLGENAVCTYTNVRPGSLTINKVTVGGDGTFSYTTSGNGLTPFTIETVQGGGAQAFSLAPGAYSVTEVVPIGWTLTSLSCTGTAAPVSVSGETLTITLAAGENAVCTYTNQFVPPAPIPTLNEWGFMALAIFLLGTGWWWTWRRQTRG